MNASWKAVVVTIGLLGAAAVPCAKEDERPKSFAGTWDATIYNLMEHPRTVAVRVRLVDDETRLPVRGAWVALTGTYTEERIGSSRGDSAGPDQPQERKFRMEAVTDEDGIAVFALQWQKQYPWRTYFGGHPPRDYKGTSGSYTVRESWGRAVDDVEKAQRLEIRHARYQFIDQALPFGRFLDVGQEKKSSSQEPKYFEKFETAWQAEGARDDVKYFVLALGTKFPDFQKTASARNEFFERVREERWGTLYKKPRNWFSKGDHPQSICGPYFAYLIEIRLQRVGKTIEVAPRERSSDSSDSGRYEPSREEGGH